MSESLDPKQLDEAAAALSDFQSKVSEKLEEMSAASEACKGEMEDDPVAVAAAGKLSAILSAISSELEEVGGMIRKLNEEKEEAERISRPDF